MRALRETWSFATTRCVEAEEAGGLPEGVIGVFEGLASVCDVENENKRLYGRDLWETVIGADDMKARIDARNVVGMLGHPPDQMNPRDAAYVTVEHRLNDDGTVSIKNEIFDTPDGRILRTLLKAKAGIGISTRGWGDEKEDKDGRLVVDKASYKLEGYDAVFNPSFVQTIGKQELVAEQVTDVYARAVEKGERFGAETAKQLLSAVGTPTAKRLLEEMDRTAEAGKAKDEVGSLQETDEKRIAYAVIDRFHVGVKDVTIKTNPAIPFATPRSGYGLIVVELEPSPRVDVQAVADWLAASGAMVWGEVQVIQAGVESSRVQGIRYESKAPLSPDERKAYEGKIASMARQIEALVGEKAGAALRGESVKVVGVGREYGGEAKCGSSAEAELLADHLRRGGVFSVIEVNGAVVTGYGAGDAGSAREAFYDAAEAAGLKVESVKVEVKAPTGGDAGLPARYGALCAATADLRARYVEALRMLGEATLEPSVVGTWVTVSFNNWEELNAGRAALRSEFGKEFVTDEGNSVNVFIVTADEWGARKRVSDTLQRAGIKMESVRIHVGKKDEADIKKDEVIPSRNTSHGFWGEMSGYLSHLSTVEALWRVAVDTLVGRFGWPEHKARDFLDSSLGRHLADEVAEVLPRGGVPEGQAMAWFDSLAGEFGKVLSLPRWEKEARDWSRSYHPADYESAARKDEVLEPLYTWTVVKAALEEKGVPQVIVRQIRAFWNLDATSLLDVAHIRDLLTEHGWGNMFSSIMAIVHRICPDPERFPRVEATPVGARKDEADPKKIKVTNPGILDVPEGKDVDSLPLSHFVALAKDKGLAPISRALGNLARWNKEKNPKLASWARDMQGKVSDAMEKAGKKKAASAEPPEDPRIAELSAALAAKDKEINDARIKLAVAEQSTRLAPLKDKERALLLSAKSVEDAGRLGAEVEGLRRKEQEGARHLGDALRAAGAKDSGVGGGPKDDSREGSAARRVAENIT